MVMNPDTFGAIEEAGANQLIDAVGAAGLVDAKDARDVVDEMSGKSGQKDQAQVPENPRSELQQAALDAARGIVNSDGVGPENLTSDNGIGPVR